MDKQTFKYTVVLDRDEQDTLEFLTEKLAAKSGIKRISTMEVFRQALQIANEKVK